ncbi:hypothetical protein T492DRAFT_857163 [Pavlovales sp. CCMP2436]|nr:hypothetical protein T492DRAFT_857163 [Pavlovales sp. CCMP2436]
MSQPSGAEFVLNKAGGVAAISSSLSSLFRGVRFSSASAPSATSKQKSAQPKGRKSAAVPDGGGGGGGGDGGAPDSGGSEQQGPPPPPPPPPPPGGGPLSALRRAALAAPAPPALPLGGSAQVDILIVWAHGDRTAFDADAAAWLHVLVDADSDDDAIRSDVVANLPILLESANIPHFMMTVQYHDYRPAGAAAPDRLFARLAPACFALASPLAPPALARKVGSHTDPTGAMPSGGLGGAGAADAGGVDAEATSGGYEVFISYSHAVSASAKAVRELLLALCPSLLIFLDVNGGLRAGTSWQLSVSLVPTATDARACLVDLRAREHAVIHEQFEVLVEEKRKMALNREGAAARPAGRNRDAPRDRPLLAKAAAPDCKGAGARASPPAGISDSSISSSIAKSSSGSDEDSAMEEDIDESLSDATEAMAARCFVGATPRCENAEEGHLALPPAGRYAAPRRAYDGPDSPRCPSGAPLPGGDYVLNDLFTTGGCCIFRRREGEQ